MPLVEKIIPGLSLSFSIAPDEGYSCLTEILGIKLIIFSCPVSLSIGFIVYFFIANPDLNQDLASLYCHLYKWSLDYSFPQEI